MSGLPITASQLFEEGDVMSPPLPFATTVRVALEGPQGFPQVKVPPQPSGMVPQVFA